MVLATDKRLFIPSPGTSAAVLMENREVILSKWAQCVKSTLKSIAGESEPILVDTLPAFLENLAEALAPDYPRKLATEGTTVASEHGGERARLTRIIPGDLIRELQILRDVILEVMNGACSFSEKDRLVVIKSIDQAMFESLTAFFLVHEGLREQFAMTLTHDLRTPLTAINASADLILRHPDRVEQVPVFTVRIKENVRRIDQMIQDLLDASRVRFGEKLNFEVSEWELLGLVRETIALLATTYGDRFNLIGEQVTGYWNKDAFRRAIENLLTNAVKYGDSSKPIQVRLECVHGRVILSVRNEGPHIPTEEQEGLFRSFMRTRTANQGQKKGWGLGLAMVRGMAEGHGGSISVDSAPDRGTTFVIDVPVDSRPHLHQPLTPGT